MSRAAESFVESLLLPPPLSTGVTCGASSLPLPGGEHARCHVPGNSGVVVVFGFAEHNYHPTSEGCEGTASSRAPHQGPTVEPPPPQRPTGTSVVDRAMRWGMRHWLLVLNSLVLLYGGLPWLAPLLMVAGYPQAGAFIFHLYTPLCHQSPHSSFFLMGHQVAFCQRETAMYTSLFLGGVLFPFIRSYLRPISLRTMVLLLVPLGIDGTTHLVDALLPSLGLRNEDHAIGSFNWWMRMVTGVLFTVAIVLGVYTRLDRELGRDEEPDL